MKGVRIVGLGGPLARYRGGTRVIVVPWLRLPWAPIQVPEEWSLGCQKVDLCGTWM